MDKLSWPSSLQLRNFIPHGLYARSLLLMVFPLILLTLSTAFIFQDSHWKHASRKLSQATASILAEKVAALKGASPAEQAAIMQSATEWLSLRMRWQETAGLPPAKPDIWLSANDDILRHELAVHLEVPFWFDIGQGEYLTIKLDIDGRILDIRAERDRVFSTHGYAFLGWVGLAVSLIIVLVVGFLRNHVNSVLKMSEVARALGKGQKVEHYRPFGATEVRSLAKAILEMHRRITSFNQQRTNMLAGVSHDLRTPLTRMRLALATEMDSELKAELEQDLNEMSDMLDAYLAFARDAKDEVMVETDILALVRGVAAKSGLVVNNKTSQTHILIALQKLAMRRAITNIIQNALAHATNTQLTLRCSGKSVLIDIDDDGPGIEEAQYDEAFQAFSRLDPSRNQNASGTGLGLTIARDVARAHGGDVLLCESPMGGLRVTLTLPN